jgi:hypothetical protein
MNEVIVTVIVTAIAMVIVTVAMMMRTPPMTIVKVTMPLTLLHRYHNFLSSIPPN